MYIPIDSKLNVGGGALDLIAPENVAGEGEGEKVAKRVHGRGAAGVVARVDTTHAPVR